MPSFFEQPFQETENDPYLEEAVQRYAQGPRHERTSSKTQEGLAKALEEDKANAKRFQFDRQDELRQVRLGRLLHHSEFIRHLNRIIPSRYGSYRRGLLGLEVLVPTDSGGEWRYVCGVQAGLAPEYSTLYFTERDLPANEMYRGWRTVLLRLILGGYISEEAAHTEFKPAEGQYSGRYNRQLQAFRNLS